MTGASCAWRRALAWVLLPWLGLSTLGCAGLPDLASPPRAASLDDDVRAHPGHYVVVTVRNSPASVNPYAASTARGYTGLGAYRAGADALDAARRIAQAHQLRQVAAWPIQVLGVHCLVYALPAAALQDAATMAQRRDAVIAALARDPDVESVQPLARFELQASAYNDPYARLQRNLQDMDVALAQQWSSGAGVQVAVVDTGVDTAHPDFAGRLGAVRDFVLDGRGAAEGHGTAVAGIIAALPNNGIGIAGIAPAARVASYRACWSSGAATGVCNSFTLAQALAAAVDTRAAIVNLSLGGPSDPLLARIVERGLARGMVFVGAVPPSGRREGFPTGIDGVIAVDAAERPLREARVLYAPGAEVFTLAPGGRYDVASGSSMAAAEVTAVSALLLALQPGLGRDGLEAVLAAAGVAPTAVARAVPTSMPAPGAAGAAGVNACAALGRLQAAAACSVAADALARTR